MEAAGLEYSGEMVWVETVMYWPQTHQVAPATEALGCTACHSEESVLDFAALGFSAEEIGRLSSVPSMEEAEDVVEEAAEAVVEEPADTAEEAAAEAPAEAVEEASSNTAIFIAIGVVVVLAVVVFGVTRKKQA